MRSASEPAMHAAVASVRAEAQPAVTRAASQSNSSAIRSPALSCSSSKSTYRVDDRCIALRTSGGILDAVSRVYVPAAFKNERTPSSPITSRAARTEPFGAAAEPEAAAAAAGRVRIDLMKPRRFRASQPNIRTSATPRSTDTRCQRCFGRTLTATA